MRMASRHLPSYIANMKATIDFDDRLYRRLKIEAARRGRTIKDLVDEGVRLVLSAPSASTAPSPPDPAAEDSWFGVLKSYAESTGAHDLDSIRGSIARGRRPKGT